MRQQKFETALRAIRETAARQLIEATHRLADVNPQSHEGVLAVIDVGRAAVVAIETIEKMAEEALARD